MQHRDQPTELAPTNAATAPATCDLDAPFVVCALYKFVALDNPARLQAPLLALLKKYDVKGSLHLAAEGLNGTLAARRPALDRILKWLRSQAPFCDLECKQSLSATLPFYRSKVKLKQELVTLGVPHLDPGQNRGTYVNAHEWNALLDDPDVLLIDTRNEYEISIGTFPGATNPHINQFRALPAYVDNHLDPAKHKKVAMFCTGGIRCEKSTAYLKQQGFDQVYHLKGGILQYLADTPRAASRWRGECFVFDQRVSVDHDLKPGHYDQCHACRHPISATDKQSEHYTIGVSCPHCWPQTAADKTRFAERQHQVELADARGQQHIGQLFSDDQ